MQIKMKRKIIKIGGSLGLILGSIDSRLENIQEGDIIEFEIKEVKKCKNQKEKK